GGVAGLPPPGPAPAPAGDLGAADLGARRHRPPAGGRCAGRRPQRPGRSDRARDGGQRVRLRSGGALDGRRGGAGQPQPQHPLWGPDAVRPGPSHRAAGGSRRDRRGGAAMTERAPALLVLADGEVFEGEAAGALAERGLATGELVFNTALSGYQEVVTDPSYAGQVIAFTYPHIGNYGTNPADDESRRPFCDGVVPRDLVA